MLAAEREGGVFVGVTRTCECVAVVLRALELAVDPRSSATRGIQTWAVTNRVDPNLASCRKMQPVRFVRFVRLRKVGSAAEFGRLVKRRYTALNFTRSLVAQFRSLPFFFKPDKPDKPDGLHSPVICRRMREFRYPTGECRNFGYLPEFTLTQRVEIPQRSLLF